MTQSFQRWKRLG